MFYGYHTCDYTTLKETTDRILSTEVDASWDWNPSIFVNLRDVDYQAGKGLFDDAYNGARKTTLTTFALENSASVKLPCTIFQLKLFGTFPLSKLFISRFPISIISMSILVGTMASKPW